jgi:polyhydroxybutyrate depolymerase
VSGIHPAVNGTPRKMPGAKTIVATWASLDGCGAEEQGEPLDVDRTVPGAETTVSRFRGCRDGAVVELFTMNGAQHVPRVDAAFASSTWSFLSAHHR